MKKKIRIIHILCFALIFSIAFSASVSASTLYNELSKDFLVTQNNCTTAFLLSPVKVSELSAENIIFFDSDNKQLSENSNIATGTSFSYFGEFGEVTQCILLGDTNCDGLITAGDARKALQMAAFIEDSEDIELFAGDINSDGSVTASDARRILRFSAQLEDFSDFKAAFNDKENKTEYDESSVTVFLKKDFDNSEESLKPEFYGSELVSEVTINNNKYKTCYILTLKKPGEENIEKLIESLNENDNIILIERNGVGYINM